MFSAGSQLFLGNEIAKSFAVLEKAIKLERGPLIPISGEKALAEADTMLMHKCILSFVSACLA